jgi:hypothetical protein
MSAKTLFKKHVAVPQDHGSWVFIVSPLLIGIFAGDTIRYATFNLIIATLAAFMLRQPATALVKVLSKRRSRDELKAAYFWLIFYGLIGVLALLALIREDYGFVVYLAVPGISIFAWHLWLVSKREERRQVNVEIIATGVLSLSAPAAYWVGIGRYDPVGWWLWILIWLQSAASIVYAYLRLSQREQAQSLDGSRMWKRGRRAALYTSFNLASILTISQLGVLPTLLFLPYLVQWLETMWGITHPATGWKPTRIGIRQLIVSTVWTVLFIAVWR